MRTDQSPLLRVRAVLRGDGSALKTDMQLGNLRDTYYEATYGSAKPPGLSP